VATKSSAALLLESLGGFFCLVLNCTPFPLSHKCFKYSLADYKPTAFLSASSMRVCHPAPSDLNRSTTSRVRRSETAILVGLLLRGANPPTLRQAREGFGERLCPTKVFSCPFWIVGVGGNTGLNARFICIGQHARLPLMFGHTGLPLGSSHMIFTFITF
jgi:hypothetical protein